MAKNNEPIFFENKLHLNYLCVHCCFRAIPIYGDFFERFIPRQESLESG